MDKPNPAPPPRSPAQGQDWRAVVFKNRGLILLPVALALVIFGQPTEFSAAIGVAIALCGELIRIWAVGYSGATTRADVVTAPKLVTAGPYAMMRNPLYVGNAIIAIGFTVAFSGGVPLMQSFWLLAFVLVIVIGVYTTIVPLEEEYLARAFGMRFTQYTTLVPRFIPWKGPIDKSKQEGKWNRSVINSAESTTIGLFVLMVIVLVLKLTVLRGWTVIL
ncbi:MAG: isoprenylcysteine carboxylmethyltransferase family protein [Candidatus Eremiobacteraeota bacterium]|nr:isoprenylcysteine carboxylmethyltransferase family protein [Candidatus Eremiobacteraeota bacterium]MBV8365028.1 isoprenylcysteine carboxylmethyltransferase family protein [Candidatus Eremiobacteraeota bacterium]